MTSLSPVVKGAVVASARSLSGRGLTLRRATWSDSAEVAAMLLQLSPVSLLRRYLTPRVLTPEGALAEADRILSQAHRAGAALLIGVGDSGHEVLVAIGELAIDPAAPAVAEVALVVRDDFQRDGVGSLLARALIAEAAHAGVATLHADFLPDNLPVRRLLRRLAMPYRLTHGPDAWRLELPLAG